MTLALYWKTQDVGTKKSVWKDFSPSCAYKTFVVTVNRFALVALLILKHLIGLNRQISHLIKHTDSTDIPVCLNKDMNGLFVADAGYVSEKLANEFNTDSRIIFAKPLKSMKKLITDWQYHLYNTRMKIEQTFRSLKMFHALVTSLPRSLDGYFGNYVYSLLAHVLA